MILKNNSNIKRDVDGNPLVSFIVTTYNLPTELLRECLDSILSLSLSRTQREIIVIDDGSDISQINELTGLRDEIVYVRQRNGGLSAARNFGIRMASGKYIQFVDGDDRIIGAPYEHCLDITRFENADVVMFEATQETVTSIPMAPPAPMTGSTYMREHNLRAAAWGYIFRRELLGELRFRPGITHEDEEFTPQLLLKAQRVYATAAKAYYYRQRHGSIIHNTDKTHIYRRLDDFESVIEHLIDLSTTASEADKLALRRRTAQLAMDYIYNTIRLTHDRRRLEATLERLESMGLFPLPAENYTRKYSAFRKIANNKLLRTLLIKATTT